MRNARRKEQAQRLREFREETLADIEATINAEEQEKELLNEIAFEMNHVRSARASGRLRLSYTDCNKGHERMQEYLAEAALHLPR